MVHEEMNFQILSLLYYLFLKKKITHGGDWRLPDSENVFCFWGLGFWGFGVWGFGVWWLDRKSTRLNSSQLMSSRMTSSA